MSEALTPEDLSTSRAWLDELFEVARDEESTLAGGTKLGIGAAAVQALRETNIRFGNPRNDLIRLTPGLFKAAGIELSALHRRQMANQFAFYYLTLTVSMQPRRGAEFTRLECTLDFGPKGGPDEPIVHTLFPRSEWKTILEWGGGMRLGLTGDLEWSAGVDVPSQIAGLALPANVSANIGSKSGLKAFVTVPDYSFKLGRADIAASGDGNSRCFWRIEKPRLQQTQSLQFGVVFKVPPTSRSISLEGLVAVEPSLSWLTANLRDVFPELNARLQAWLRGDTRDGGTSQQVAIGDHEAWLLELPDATS